MPRRHDIKSILIIGAGPIVIGQACEFDYSGTQACRAIKQEGYRVILVNSNPATIMTDPDLVDATYIEPLTAEFVTRIIEKEKPDALLPTMGGQTALNIAMTLSKQGVLKKHGVTMIGANEQAINKAENRQDFHTAMTKIGLDMPKSYVASTVEEAMKALKSVGLPAIIRPSFTLGGKGGGIAYSEQEFRTIIKGGLDSSPVREVLVEESVIGWKEFEMEVVRDKADNCIIICSIENLDPMGVHTGDSITVAPALTLTDKEYQRMRNASIAILREIGVETGGSNVQFAINPKDGRLVVIEMNPRVSRSSALASKATGFPIAKVAAKLAVGYLLDEILNDITKATPAAFEPTLDYVVTKVPCFAFDKFPQSTSLLTTSMKSVGEAMALGRNFTESLQKALRSTETGLTGLNSVRFFEEEKENPLTKKAMLKSLGKPRSGQVLYVAEALRRGCSVQQVHAACNYDPWFLRQLEKIIEVEKKIQTHGLPQNKSAWHYVKHLGFGDAQLGALTNKSEKDVRSQRWGMGVHPVFKRIDTCAGEFVAPTPYMYATYENPLSVASATSFDCGDSHSTNACEASPEDTQKVIILGSGPNRIGQGIEFDYCCCHAAFAVKEVPGLQSIMINCNPETVSTDYDTSDRLYFEPLTEEDVLEVLRVEAQKGTLKGVIVQFGGQTPLKLAAAIAEAGIHILGTPVDSIDLAEDRDRFQKLITRLGLRQPQNAMVVGVEEALQAAKRIGYPVVVRPSYVLGGRAMEIISQDKHLETYIKKQDTNAPILIDSYLEGAIEVDTDILSDGDGVFVAGILEHVEEAGVHSGDSSCSLPAHTIAPAMLATIKQQASKLARALHVRGLMNIQFALKDDTVFVLEANPRASRTVPFIAKAIHHPLAAIATHLMLGKKLSHFNLREKRYDYIAVKEAVFPFHRLPGVDTILGPEMRSTGEVMGLASTFALAFAKSQLAGGTQLPVKGTAFLSVKDTDKPALPVLAQQLEKQGFCLMATQGTADFLRQKGCKVNTINKVSQGSPHIVEALESAKVHLIVNTTQGELSVADSLSIRRAALFYHIPYTTTMAGAKASVAAIKAIKEQPFTVTSLQDYAKKQCKE